MTDRWWFKLLVVIGLQRDLLDLLDPENFRPGLSRELDLWIHMMSCASHLADCWPTWRLAAVSGLVAKVLKLQACFLQGVLYLEWYCYW